MFHIFLNAFSFFSNRRVPTLYYSAPVLHSISLFVNFLTFSLMHLLLEQQTRVLATVTRYDWLRLFPFYCRNYSQFLHRYKFQAVLQCSTEQACTCAVTCYVNTKIFLYLFNILLFIFHTTPIKGMKYTSFHTKNSIQRYSRS